MKYRMKMMCIPAFHIIFFLPRKLLRNPNRCLIIFIQNLGNMLGNVAFFNLCIAYPSLASQPIHNFKITKRAISWARKCHFVIELIKFTTVAGRLRFSHQPSQVLSTSFWTLVQKIIFLFRQCFCHNAPVHVLFFKFRSGGAFTILFPWSSLHGMPCIPY